MIRLTAIAIVACWAAGPGAFAIETDYSAELPRIAPLEPAEAAESIEIVDGFRIELVAAEPLVTDPVAMAFDADGRLFVIEMRDYSEHPEERLGRVRLLEDTDGDGRMDRATIYADGLSWPTAIICWDRGVFIGAAPDIIYLKDTTGDGRADVRRTVFTGFGRANVQGLLNSFLWGLDNRIYGSSSVNGGRVRRADDPDGPVVELRGRDFAFDPRTLDLRPVAGGAQHGACFDDWGVRFVSSNSDHLQMIVQEDSPAAGAHDLSLPPQRLSIAADGGQAQVFRMSPVEPWRIVRTRLRASGQVPGIVEGGGRPAGYFTGATGATVYRGDAWPAEFRGQVFIADVGGNLIHRKRLEPEGIAFIGRRIDEQREFLASRDIWFRPVQMANAPDGNLWVMDMYREVIEHPASIPPIIKKHLDLDSGRDRGRIYRIVHESASPRPAPRLSTASTGELVKLLAHPNAWHRETSARLLHERQDAGAIPHLLAAAAGSSPHGRLHALYTLRGLGALTEQAVLAGLDDEHPRLVEHAIVLATPWSGRKPTAGKLFDLALNGADLRIRWRAAGALGGVEERAIVLTNVLRRDGRDPWVRHAAIAALGDEAAAALASLVADGSAHRQVIEGLARNVSVRDLEFIVRAASTAFPLDAAAVARGLSARHPVAAETLVRQILPQCRAVALSAGEAIADRAEATQTLALVPASQALPVLTELLHPRQPSSVQLAAVAALDAVNEDQVADALLSALAGAAPAVRTRILEAMLARPQRAAALLDAVETGRLSAGELPAEHRARLVAHPQRDIRERAGRLLAVNADRAAVVERYQREMRELTGDAARGRQVFLTACAVCHRVGDVGVELGPSLSAFVPRGAEALVLNVLDPNREVNPQFINYMVTTTDGRTLAGIIVAETAGSLTLTAGAGGAFTVARDQIVTMTSTGQSLMPIGLEAALSPQAMADLFAYITAPSDGD